MANHNSLFQVEYEAETDSAAGWAANTDTYATHRVPIVGPIDTSGLVQDAIEPGRTVQTLQGGTAPILGPKGGSFRMRLWLHGHGSSTSGATTIDAVETFLGYAFGKPSGSTGALVSASAGTTINGSGSTTTILVTTASATFARGSLCRVGASGLSADGRGSGQWYAVGDHTSTNLTLRHATITAAANADVVYSATNFWLPELATNSGVRGLRMRFVTPDQQYRCHGCFPMSITFGGLNPAETPYIEIEWGVTWWTSTSGGTWPSAVSRNDYNPAPIGGGSMVIGDVGSSTRTAYSIRAFSVSVELGIVPLDGHGGADPYGRYVGAVRTPSKIRASFTIDAETAGTNTFETKYLAGTSQWFTWSGSTAAGSALGMHAQNFKLDKRPKQIAGPNGINSFVVEGYCCSGTTDTTTDLSQAALVVAYA
jgi:hypothetical protein